MDGFITDLDEAVESYRVRQKTLLEEWQQAAARPSREATRAITSIGRQPRRDAVHRPVPAYVLSYLSSVGFLPSLSHDSVQALKDYAPGQLVYARGAKWFVDEVDLRRANNATKPVWVQK